MKYHSLFLSKIRKDVEKFVVCCSRDWRFKGLHVNIDSFRVSPRFCGFIVNCCTHCLVLVLLFSTLCLSSFAIILMGKRELIALF